MENFVSAVSNALQSAAVHRLMSDYYNALSSVVQSTASTLNALAATPASINTAVTTGHSTNSAWGVKMQ